MRMITRVALLIAVVASSTAHAEPCRIGTNMPAIDANPAKPILAGQATARCETKEIEYRNRDGSVGKLKMWSFSTSK